MTYGVTDQGFNAKRTEDIIVEINEDISSVFGDSIDLDETGPIGQIVSLFGDRLGSIWSFMEQVYNSQYPITGGTSLDNVAAITGSVRDKPRSSKVQLTLFGDVGTIIEKDKTVSVNGNSSAKFNTDTLVVIAPGTDEVQRITWPVLPEAGTFTLEFNGSVTGALNWDATAAQIQTAMEALTTVGAGNITVAGDVQSGFSTFTFISSLGSAPQINVTISSNNLTSSEQTSIACVADVSNSLDRTSLILYDQAGSVGVWIDIDNSGSTVPPAALAADRQIEITGVVLDDTDVSVAAAMAAILSADSEFSVIVVGNALTITDVNQGARVDGADVDTGFTLATPRQGYSPPDLPGNITEDVIGVLPQVNVQATSQETGPIQGPSGTLTVIETPVTGWSSVTNALDAELGADVENDVDFRLKRDEELATAGRATPDAIRAQLLKVDNVQAVVVFENDKHIEDVDGRPPNSLDIVVQGGDEDEIAEKIWDTRAGGIQTIGDITKTVVDSQGFDQTVKFSRPTDVSIWVELDLTIDTNNYPLDGDDQVKAAIVVWGDTLGIGKDVIVHGSDSLECSFSDIPGITDIVIKVGKTASPTADDNIVIAAREVSAFDTSRIAITQI